MARLRVTAPKRLPPATRYEAASRSMPTAGVAAPSGSTGTAGSSTQSGMRNVKPPGESRRASVTAAVEAAMSSSVANCAGASPPSGSRTNSTPGGLSRLYRARRRRSSAASTRMGVTERIFMCSLLRQR